MNASKLILISQIPAAQTCKINANIERKTAELTRHIVPNVAELKSVVCCCGHCRSMMTTLWLL